MVILNLLLDLVLIGLLCAGISYAIKLSRHLADLRAHRAEMEAFVKNFNAAILRAEAGVQALKSTARSCGDDLEGLVEKGRALRDELLFLTESADRTAEKLSAASLRAAKPAPAKAEQPPPIADKEKGAAPAPASPASAAERDLMRVLGKR